MSDKLLKHYEKIGDEEKQKLQEISNETIREFQQVNKDKPTKIQEDKDYSINCQLI